MDESPEFGTLPAGVEARPRHGAYAVIRDDGGRVAAVRTGTGDYWLPGGGIESGESPEQAVLREIREELGAEARLLAPFGRARQHFYAESDGCWYDMTAHFFRAELLTPITDPPDEVDWLDPERDAARFRHQCHAWAVARAAAFHS